MKVSSRWSTHAHSPVILIFLLSCALPTLAAVRNVVTGYGASANNSHDDGPNINNAIAALQSGDTLYFPCGTYLVATALNTIAVSNVTVEMNNCATLHTTAGRYALSIGHGGLSASTPLTADAAVGATSFQANFSAIGLVSGDYAVLEEGGADVARAITDPTSCSAAVQCRTDVVHIASVSGNTATIDTSSQTVPGLHFPFNTVNAAKVFKIVSPTSGVQVQNGTIDGTGGGSGMGGLITRGVVETSFSNLTIQHFALEGVASWWTYNEQWTTVTIKDAGADGGYGAFEAQIGGHTQIQGMTFASMRPRSWPMFIGEGGDHTISNVDVDGGNVVTSRMFNVGATAYDTFNTLNVHDSDPSSIDNGITIQYYAQHLTWNNCTVTNIGQTNATGLAIGAFGNDNSYNTFNNCTVTNSKGWLLANGGLNDTNWTVSGGTYKNAVSTGNDVIHIVGNGGHYIHDATVSGPGNYGINLSGASNSCVNNNVLTAGSSLMGGGIYTSDSTVVGSGNTTNGLSSNLANGTCGNSASTTPAPPSGLVATVQ
jgi:hypothetical protein